MEQERMLAAICAVIAFVAVSLGNRLTRHV